MTVIRDSATFTSSRATFENAEQLPRSDTKANDQHKFLFAMIKKVIYLII